MTGNEGVCICRHLFALSGIRKEPKTEGFAGYREFEISAADFPVSRYSGRRETVFRKLYSGNGIQENRSILENKRGGYGYE